jgi:hypothetical protein
MSPYELRAFIKNHGGKAISSLQAQRLSAVVKTTETIMADFPMRVIANLKRIDAQMPDATAEDAVTIAVASALAGTLDEHLDARGCRSLGLTLLFLNGGPPSKDEWAAAERAPF